MHIAFLSYEYPLETGGGGIGTYLELISNLLYSSGHLVTVFAGTKKANAFWESEIVYRIPAQGWEEFNKTLPQYFIPLHAITPFDVAECTDFCGCGLYLKKKLPELPIVVKLHTPLYMVDRLLFQPLSFAGKFRFVLGALKRLKVPQLPIQPQSSNYKDEFELINLAERISSPSFSIYDEMKTLGFQLEDKTDFVPLPFLISDKLKNLKPRPIIKENPQIIFIGRLEKRKGVIDLAIAIPKVLKQFPNAHFTFVGGASQSPVPGVDMISYLRGNLKEKLHAVTFTGKIKHEQVTNYLSQGDIFVFPSHYESFGIVCCEAMAAGKAVIASKNGGMAEIIENEKSGIVIKPKNALLLTNTICRLIEDDGLRISIGKEARNRIAKFLDTEKTIGAQVSCYKRAIG